jgi:pyrroline-5-carboxylate reductase
VMVQKTLGFMGFGNMGMAIAGGLLEKGTLASRQVIIYDLDETKRDAAEQMGIGVAESPEQLAQACDILILATKPQGIPDALEQIKSALTPKVLVVSICAGVSIGFFQKTLGEDFRVVRVMPNTPALVSEGAAGIALSANCSETDGELARAIFESIGLVELVPEEAIDAVTALSGSGPAYFFYMVECLVKAATHEGLDKDQATRLAAQTLLGAGRLLMESGESAGVLRDRVTSRGGTTAAALQAFMEHGFEAIIQTGVAAAAARSKALGQ